MKVYKEHFYVFFCYRYIHLYIFRAWAPTGVRIYWVKKKKNPSFHYSSPKLLTFWGPKHVQKLIKSRLCITRSGETFCNLWVMWRNCSVAPPMLRLSQGPPDMASSTSMKFPDVHSLCPQGESWSRWQASSWSPLIFHQTVWPWWPGGF